MAETQEKKTIVIDSLTPEQEALIQVVKDEYLDFVFNREVKPWTEEQKELIRNDVNWLYGLANLEPPKFGVTFAKSPMDAQDIANRMMKFGEDKWEANPWPENTPKEYYAFAYYGNYSDLCWVAHFDYFTRIGVINHEPLNRYKKFLREGQVYDMLQFDTVCIVIPPPVEINRRDIVPHGEDRPAIRFEDGYSLFFWNGVNVPKKLIMTPELLTREDLIKETNAERRRCFMEKLGAKRFYEILGTDIQKVDRQVDKQGNIMTLYITGQPDEIINEKIQFIQVTCPSTLREYTLYPPKNDDGRPFTSVEDAKLATFKNEPIAIRHGDVGLHEVDGDNVLELES